MDGFIRYIGRIFAAVAVDLWAGLTGLFLLLRRRLEQKPPATRQSQKARSRRGRQRFRWPSTGLLMIGGVSTLLWGFATLLVVNIRFASEVLPDAPGDLYGANRPASLTILDREGTIIGTRGSIYGDPVPVAEIPPILIEAVISTEDRRFYRHIGFDTRGLTRAILTNLRAGDVVEGGSTITQQLAKNLFLTPEKTLLRKLEEIQLALWLEARFTKDEILDLYLNRIYIGAGTYGIEAAANAYFDKSARDLTDAEAVMLAGIPQAPSNYAPTTNYAAATARAAVVVDNLVETGKIDKAAAAALKAVPAQVVDRPARNNSGYFLDHVVAELTSRLGETGEDLVVTTTLDSRLQALAEKAVTDVMATAPTDSGADQAALIAYDESGGIVAMVGGRNYADSQFNRATQARRQPGSAFKPFVFLAAMEAGLSPETIVIDRPVKVKEWTPSNYNDSFRGGVRLSTAVARSINTVAVQVTEAIGRERVIDAARRAGVETPLDAVPSIALGALEITLDELTAAYMPFAHRGLERPAHAITHVRTRTGQELGAFSHRIDDFQIIESGHAMETTRMMMQVVRNGTGQKAAMKGWDVAGKTGTTNEWRDAWFVGFTSALTTGVWVGNDASQPMTEITGASLPLQIWHQFMINAHTPWTPASLLDAGHVTLEDVSRLGGFYTSLRGDLIDVIYGPAPLADPDLWTNSPPAEVSGEPASGQSLASNTRVVGRAAPGAQVSND